MKATGVVRSIDELGRLVIPKQIRKNMDIRTGDPLEIFVEGADTIVIKKYSCACVFCQQTEDLVDFKGKKICSACLLDLSKA